MLVPYTERISRNGGGTSTPKYPYADLPFAGRLLDNVVFLCYILNMNKWIKSLIIVLLCLLCVRVGISLHDKWDDTQSTYTRTSISGIPFSKK